MKTVQTLVQQTERMEDVQDQRNALRDVCKQQATEIARLTRIIRSMVPEDQWYRLGVHEKS